MRVAFAKPVHAAQARIDPPGANHGPFTAKPSSFHAHSTLWVTPPTFPCPTHLPLSHTVSRRKLVKEWIKPIKGDRKRTVKSMTEYK